MKTSSASKIHLIPGDCIQELKKLPDNSVDAIVTDPPYGLSKEPDISKVMQHWIDDTDYMHTAKGFMGKTWDSFVPGPKYWKEVYRVLKPGGHALVFAGRRTQDLMGIALRFAGFEIRDCLSWLYGSGFPKSLDISKAIDKAAGAERPRIAGGQSGNNTILGAHKAGEAISGEAKQWSGWGTSLKPANEPILLARKPLSEKTVAANVLKWGTGGINVDGSRIEVADSEKASFAAEWDRFQSGAKGNTTYVKQDATYDLSKHKPQGRFPANLILDKGAAEMLGESSRFFYVVKASKRERGEGNSHPTVKPIKLMRYLCKLITPPNGVVLDPFMGSGSTGIAAVQEGLGFIGIEKDTEYFDIAERRISKSQKDKA